jgi:hypothetical protein
VQHVLAHGIAFTNGGDSGTVVMKQQVVYTCVFSVLYVSTDAISWHSTHHWLWTSPAIQCPVTVSGARWTSRDASVTFKPLVELVLALALALSVGLQSSWHGQQLAGIAKTLAATGSVLVRVVRSCHHEINGLLSTAD